MSGSKHLTAEQWLDLLEDRHGPAERERVRAHVESCRACSRTYQRLRPAHERLREAARASAAAGSLSARAQERIWDGLRFRVRRALVPEPQQSEIHLERLRSLLAELCGRATAEGAIDAAVRDGGPQPFARDLSSIVEVLCGDRAARLVRGAAEKVRDRVA